MFFTLYKRYIFWNPLSPTINWPTDHLPITNADPPNSLRNHPTWYYLIYNPYIYRPDRPAKPTQNPLNLTWPCCILYKPYLSWKLTTATIHWPNDHSSTYTLLAVWAPLACDCLTFWGSHCCTVLCSIQFLAGEKVTFVCWSLYWMKKLKKNIHIQLDTSVDSSDSCQLLFLLSSTFVLTCHPIPQYIPSFLK